MNHDQFTDQKQGAFGMPAGLITSEDATATKTAG